MLYLGEEYLLSPLPRNSSGNIVHGVACAWTTSNIDIALIASDGTIRAQKPGQCAVTGTVGSSSVTVTVEVREGPRPVLNQAQWDTEHAQDCGTPVNALTLNEPDEPAEKADAAKPFNATGHPRFHPNAVSQASAAGTDDQLGSSNFSFTVPIFSSAGRGVGVGLALFYNSRVWSKEGANKMVFDYDQGWPAPGFRLNYGRIIPNYDVAGGSTGNHLLIESDGTRTPLFRQTGGIIYRSDDGRHIEFNDQDKKLTYPDGTTLLYDPNTSNSRLMPIAIKDINGNSISITYVNHSSCSDALRVETCTCGASGNCTKPSRQAIKKITDTLGRHITFYYFANGHLAEIRAPRYNDTQSQDRVVAKFYYQTETLSYNFGSMQVINPSGNQINALRRVYFPDTGRGYVFDEYSGYGMATRLSMRLGMTNSDEGTEVAYTKYLYNTSGQLSDAPQFNQRQEWWQDKTDGDGNTDLTPSVYSYARQNNGSTVTNSVTSLANNIRVEMISGNNSGSTDFGLVTTQKIIAPNNVVLFQQDHTYSNSSSQSGLQREKVSTTDDATPAGNRSRVENVYGQYGRLMETIEYGFQVSGSFKKRRRTVYTYSDNAGHIGNGLLLLAKDVKVYDAKVTDDNNDDTLIARTRYKYDCEDCAAQAPDWNRVTYDFTDDCSPQTNPACMPPPGYDTRRVSRDSRGQITKVELWTDAASVNPQISFRHRYDIFGNLIKSQLSCCSLKRYNFGEEMHYSAPLSVVEGGEAPQSLTTNYFYDLNTSFLKEMRDPNGLSTTYTPDSALRVRTVTYPKLSSDMNSNPTLETFYNDQVYPGKDGLVYESRFTYMDAMTQRVEVSRQWMDGMGRTLRAGSGTGTSPTSFDAAKTIYDGLGRVRQTSNPYSGDQDGKSTATLNWTTYDYDSLGRVYRTTLPDSGLVETVFNGATTIVRDPVGRERRSEVDGLGRLIKVTEMDASKALTWDTTYTYDMNDNLLLINQGGQTRAFKYDSLSRMLFERTPEQDARINDGTNTMWSVKYTYNEFNAVATRQDARGVITTYQYDELNRLKDVIYNTTATTAQATTNTHLDYGTAVPDLGRIKTITDSAGTESYVYDDLSRVSSKTRTIDGRGYTTSYRYNQAGRLKRLTYPSTRIVDIGYDAEGRLTSVGGTRSYITGVVYNSAQQATSVSRANGLTESYGYSNDRLQLTSQSVRKGTDPPLLSITYGYNADSTNGGGTRSGNTGQLISSTATINGQDRSQSFKYDQVGRLSEATGRDIDGPWKRKYDYDRWGNRTRVYEWLNAFGLGFTWCTKQIARYAHNAGVPTTNRITDRDTIFGCDATIPFSMQYDYAGNLTSNNEHDFTYDAESRVVRSAPSSTTNYTDYRYDSANRRLSKQGATGTVHYIWEGGQLIAEHNAATGQAVAEYVYAGGRMIAREAGGAVMHYHQDRLSVRLLTDGSGNWAGTQSHDPFGEEMKEGFVSSKWRFTSYERDAETNSDYAVNRQYWPVTGRFNRPDPIPGIIIDPQSLNRYAYVRNDPITFVDPLGLLRVACAAVSITAITYRENGTLKSVLSVLGVNYRCLVYGDGRESRLRESIAHVAQSYRRPSKDDCAQAIADLASVVLEFDRKLVSAVMYGQDEGHHKKMLQLKDGVRSALDKVMARCFDKDGGPRFPDITGQREELFNNARDIIEGLKKIPDIGTKGVDYTSLKLGGALGAIGGALTKASRAVLKLIFNY